MGVVRSSSSGAQMAGDGVLTRVVEGLRWGVTMGLVAPADTS